MLVMARTGEDAETGRAQLSLFVVDPDAAGAGAPGIPTAMHAPEHQSTLFFDDVRVGEDRLSARRATGCGSASTG